MMNKIIKNEQIAPHIYFLEVLNEQIAASFMPGQFCIIMIDEIGERIPLTIYDVTEKSVKMIYQVIGESTLLLSKVSKGEELYAFLGPLGNKSELINNEEIKKVLFVAGGIGIAPVYPQVKFLANKNIHVDVIYGVKNKEMIILEDEVKMLANKLIITTDDGSYQNKGFVTDVLDNIDLDYDVCVAIGPLKMMEAVAKKTAHSNLKTIVSMNPIMVDGTGMCGACRVIVDNDIKFACVDGPEFDGHKVDFESVIKRMETYKSEEGRAYLRALEGEKHHGSCGACGHDE